MVDNAVATVRSLIDQRKHELTVSLSPQAIWVHADAARLEQVVVNLLTNAAKYTDQGGHVWLTLQQEGEEAVLRVRDTGVGIAPEMLPASSTCSRRRNVRWTARKAGWASDWLWYNALWKCTGERWRLPVLWGKVVNSSCVCRWCRLPTAVVLASRRNIPAKRTIPAGVGGG